ncbi:PREDICTED: 26S protease regulatory subunit 7 homolog A-like [Camelina sativa]|uniref:26S protease regulatory subunit 7 homolog A-like n=1 Tax=Camelina sativa TaxID=90675 RepID=A0ABM0X169_CAMSA|nr:PREDICTED: 26S protease regulatory subunit 7 homolog A-like [Camelina sativa]
MSVIIVTNIGNLVIHLHTDECPITCTNFLKLCKIKYYNDCLFHTIKDSIAKTGDPTGTGTGGDSIYKFLEGDDARFFTDEIHHQLTHSKAGTVAMASSGENLNASQFYITLCDNLDYLDGKHTVFGKIVEGFDVLNTIAEASVDAKNRPLKAIQILFTFVLVDPFDDPPQLAGMIPDANAKEEVIDDERFEDNWVPMDEALGPQELEEVINQKAPQSSAFVLETIGEIPEAVDPDIWGLNHVTDDERLNSYCFARIKKIEKEISDLAEKMNNLCVSKDFDSDTGLTLPNQWDLVSDKQMIDEDQPLLVATCTHIIRPHKYVIHINKMGKFIVGLGDKVSPTDIEEGMRVGVDRKKYQIQIPLPPKIGPSVTMMTVEEKPDVTYSDIGGCKEQIGKIREVVELTMLHPEKFVRLGIDPPKGVLCYGPPGTGKTLVARAVANRTGACFIRVIGSELVQKYIGEGARMVRELFQLARSKRACILFFDEIDAIGGARFDDGVGGDNEVQRTMLEIMNQLDGFDPRGNVKVIMATNRHDILDPALLRHGRLDRKVEFCLPDLEGRIQIFKIHTRTMSCERDIRFELLAGLCPNSTGADIRSVCIEAGMYAIGARRKAVTEKDFLDAVNKVVRGYQKFSATPKYMAYYT